MSRKYYYLLMIILFFSANYAEARRPMKKFENPALQFVGTWRVEAYDWREFRNQPMDLEKQLALRAASFPPGQIIQIEWTGLSLMPGNYNSERMESDGPIGETLSISVLAPFARILCRGYWENLCTTPLKNYVKNFMIVEIVKWDAKDQARKSIWPEMKPIEYRLVDLSKSHNIDVWFDKHGDMIFPIYIDGQSKQGTDYGILGVRLKRIK